jgi:hypothetical protein
LLIHERGAIQRRRLLGNRHAEYSPQLVRDIFINRAGVGFLFGNA